MNAQIIVSQGERASIALALFFVLIILYRLFCSKSVLHGPLKFHLKRHLRGFREVICDASSSSSDKQLVFTIKDSMSLFGMSEICRNLFERKKYTVTTSFEEDQEHHISFSKKNIDYHIRILQEQVSGEFIIRLI